MTTSISKIPQPLGLRVLLTLCVPALLFFSGCTHHTEQSSKTDQTVVRIGYQKAGILNILKVYGTLDDRLAKQGIAVQWLQFAAGPQILEGLGAHSVDIGATGDTPPIFAQAAGVDLVYVANIPPGDPAGQAIIVPANSTIHTAADLRGKRIAFQKGSGAHYFLIQALTRAGVKYSDITPEYMSPADASAAFVNGSIDAWVIWDPFLTIAEKHVRARVLLDGKGLPTPGTYYLASRSFAQEHADLLAIVLDEARKAGVWTSQHPAEAAAKVAPSVGLSPATLEALYLRGGSIGYRPMSPQVIALQQKEADTFVALGLLPRPVKIQAIVLPPAANIAERSSSAK